MASALQPPIARRRRRARNGDAAAGAAAAAAEAPLTHRKHDVAARGVGTAQASQTEVASATVCWQHLNHAPASCIWVAVQTCAAWDTTSSGMDNSGLVIC